MRRLLCNQVNIALAVIVLQIIISQYYHGADCQKIGKVTREALPVKPLLKKFGPIVSSSYKKFSKPFFKTLSKVSIDETGVGKREVEEATDPVVGSAKEVVESKDYGKTIKHGLQKGGEFFDIFTDELFFDGENSVDSGSDPVVGSAKDGGDEGGYETKMKQRLLKTEKIVDKLMDRFFGSSEKSAKNVDNNGDPVVGSAKNSGGGKKGYGYGNKIGSFVDKLMDKFLPDSGSGNDDGDPVVGSAQGSGDSTTNGRNFESTLRKAGKIVDKFIQIMGDTGNSDTSVDSSGDPMVGSAKGETNSEVSGIKFEDRLQKSGKYADIIMDTFFSVLDSSEEMDYGDGGGDPVVGSSAQGAGNNEKYGGNFEDAMHHTGKFVDVLMKHFLDGSEEEAGGNASDDPVVGSARGETNNEDSGIKFQHYLRRTGKYIDKFFNKFFGESAEENTGNDPLIGSANPNSDLTGVEETSNDNTEEPIEDETTTELPTSEELFKDLENYAQQPVEDECACEAKAATDDDELFTDFDDGTGDKSSINENTIDETTFKPKLFGSKLGKLLPLKLHFPLPVKFVPWKPQSLNNKRQLAPETNEALT